MSDLAPYPVYGLASDAPDAGEGLGTKRKFWCHHAELGASLFKMGRPRHQENTAEKAGAELARLLGIPAAQVELGVYNDPEHGPLEGTLSPQICRDEQILEFGNTLLAYRVSGYPTKEKRTRSHTVSLVLDALESEAPHPHLATEMENAAEQFVGYLLFDAWIGNMDRHHENWALVQPIAGGAEARFLSPSFDHGSSLGRELTDEVRRARLAESERVRQGEESNRSVEHYATAPSARGRLFLSPNSDKALSPLDAYAEAARRYPRASKFWRDRLSDVQGSDIRPIFSAFPPGWCSDALSAFAQALLAVNRERILPSPHP